MDFDVARPKLARGLRDGSWLFGGLAGLLLAEQGVLMAAIAGLAVWIFAQALAVVVESIVVRRP